jgi:Protein of unknown function (DUF3592)
VRHRGIFLVAVSLGVFVLYAKGGGIAGALALVSAILTDMASTLLLVGGLLTVGAAVGWRRATKVAAWPTVNGEVTSAEIVSRKRDIGLTMGNHMRARFYRARLLYRYEVGGRRLEGHVVRLVSRGWSRQRADAEATLSRYHVGQAVVVHYDPRRPGTSLIEPGVGPLWWQAVLIVAVLVSLGVYGWLPQATR